VTRTPPLRSLAPGALALALAMALAGCISVLPKKAPVQLYRFGLPDAAAATPGPVSVAKGQENFQPEASTDRILTVDGQSVAYIGEARWAEPAPVLFDEALTRAFQAQGAPRLVQRGALPAPPYTLSLDVQSFEARYDQGASAAPEAVIQIRAVLLRSDTRAVVAEQLIASSSRASDNRVGPIVAAYDAAVRDAMGKLVTWTGQNAR
jgi:cholesterol transport system auxiliary component